MKKILLSTILTFATIFLSHTLTGCMDLDTRTSEEMREDFAKDFMSAMNSGDEAEVKKLFAPAKFQEYPSFDDDIQDLLDYIDGEIVSFNPDGGGEIYDSDADEGFRCRVKDFAVIFYTADKEYRVACHYCCEYVQDWETDHDMIGVWSLYIIDAEDYIDDKSYTYWGDGMRTPGIHIGVNPKDQT